MYRPDIVSVFRRTVRRHGGRPFLIDSQLSVTYAEADRLSDAAAAELVDRGVAPGDTVGFCASDRVSLWLGVIAAWEGRSAARSARRPAQRRRFAVLRGKTSMPRLWRRPPSAMRCCSARAPTR